MNFEVIRTYPGEHTRHAGNERPSTSRGIVNADTVDEFAQVNDWPYAKSIPMSEHLTGWAEEGSFDPVGWVSECGAECTARLLYPGEKPSLTIAPRHMGRPRAF